MKKLIIFALAFLAIFKMNAQSPEKISFQAVIRDTNNVLISNSVIGVKLSLLQGNSSGTEVFTEELTIETNENGLFSTEFGQLSDELNGFTNIDWSDGPYFLKVQVDPNGGQNYSIVLNNELQSVPYALYAKTAESANEKDPVFTRSAAYTITSDDIVSWNARLDDETQTLSDVLSQGNSANNMQIKELAEPTDSTDAATKGYVDAIKELMYEEMLNSGQFGILRDIDGNLYKTVNIYGEVWMAENLRTTTLNDGTPITLVEDNTEWANSTVPSYCYHSNNVDNAAFYGALYNWETVNTEKVCPTGWHVPESAEFNNVIANLGGTSVAGGRMKETGNQFWYSNTDATNWSNFSARGGSFRNDIGTYGIIRYSFFVWSATENSSTDAVSYTISRGNDDIGTNNYEKAYGESIRCKKD